MATLIKLIATHKPSGAQEVYGPWEEHDDPSVRIANASFAHGYVSGLFTAAMGDSFNMEDFDFSVIQEPAATSVGTLQAEASISVTHPDGTVS